MGARARIADGLASLELFGEIVANLHPSKTAPLVIALDIESSSSRGRILELGISTFDPSCLLLHHQLSNDNENDKDGFFNASITTHWYAVPGNKNRHRSKPYRLGVPEQPLRNENVHQILDTHLRPRKTSNNGEEQRKVILVGHGINCDLSFFKQHYGIDLTLRSNVEAIWDTQVMAELVLEPLYRASLKKVLQTLRLDYIGLHNAGHDSRYTLRAALMLFVVSESKRDNSSRTILLLKDIARSHKINEGRKWTVPLRTKVDPSPDIFLQDLDAEGGVMNLFA